MYFLLLRAAHHKLPCDIVLEHNLALLCSAGIAFFRVRSVAISTGWNVTDVIKVLSMCMAASINY